MILGWEAGKPALAPMAEEMNGADNQFIIPLSRSDRWQFDLWRLIRTAIDQPSPPVRDRNAE